MPMAPCPAAERYISTRPISLIILACQTPASPFLALPTAYSYPSARLGERMTTGAEASPGAGSPGRTDSACERASALPRVPMRSDVKACPDRDGKDRGALRDFGVCGANRERLSVVRQVRARLGPAIRP